MVDLYNVDMYKCDTDHDSDVPRRGPGGNQIHIYIIIKY